MRALAWLLVVAALGVSPSALADGGGRATDLAHGFGSLWTTSPGAIVRLDARTGRMAAKLGAGPAPLSAITTGAGAVWGLLPWTVLRVDPRSGALRRFHVPGPAYAFAIGFGKVWVARYDDGTLYALDPASGEIVRAVAGIPSAVEAVSVGRGSVWVVSVGPWRRGPGGTLVPRGPGTLSRISPTSGKILARIRVGRGAGAVAVGTRTVWVANFRGVGSDSSLSRIDLRTNHVAATIRLPARPVAVEAGAGFVWTVIGADAAGRIVRVDPRTNRTVVRRVPRSWVPSAVAVFRGRVWVASGGSATVTRFNPRTLASQTFSIPR